MFRYTEILHTTTVHFYTLTAVFVSSYPGGPGGQVSRAEVRRRRGRRGEEEHGGEGRGEEGGSSLTDRQTESQSVFTLQQHGDHLMLLEPSWNRLQDLYKRPL